MYAVVVMPLSEYLAGEEDDFELGAELLAHFQETLSAEVGFPVVWSEQALEEGADFEPEDLDPEALWALRVVAAWLEQHESLEGCEPGEEPWEHSVFESMADTGSVQRFRQILNADPYAVCYAPVDLPDVFFLSPAEEGEDDDEADSAHPPEEEDFEEGVGLGSLPALIEELEILREALELPEKLEDIAVEEFVDDPDAPLSAAKFAWFVLRERAQEAQAVKIPLMVLLNEMDDELDDGLDDEDKAD